MPMTVEAAHPEPETDAPLGRIFAGALARIGADDIPPEILKLTQSFVLDTLGVLVAGTKAPGIVELAAAIQQMEPGNGVATILTNGQAVSPLAAVLVNAAAAHALDFDDTHDEARIHAFSVVLPVAFAAAELEGRISGRDFLAAIAIGAEAFCRFGLALPHHLAKGWHPTTGFGCFAAAVTAGKIMRLDAEQMTHALALAYVQMSGNTQSITDGALSKRLGPGFAARNGLLAAQLARAGLTGPWRFLEGTAGLFAMYGDEASRPHALIENLGTAWALADLSMKPYPCCRCAHTLISIGIDLHREGIKPSDIERGVLYLGETNHKIVGSVFDPAHDNPVVHAQFNACYAFAQALEDGAVGIDTFAPDRVRAQTKTASKLTCAIGPDIPPNALAPARVHLRLTNGSERVIDRPAMKGSPDDPMTEAEIFAKFSANLQSGWGVGHDAAERLAAIVSELDTTDDAQTLIHALKAELDAAAPARVAAA